MPKVYLSLGSNLGDRARNLEQGLRLLREGGLVLHKISSVYETYPIGATPEPRYYYNLAVQAEVELEPYALLTLLQEVERRVGRTPAVRWAPRVLDIDLLLYNHLTLQTPDLTLPHPRMKERAFVLIPLFEIEPDLCLPDGTSVRDLLRRPELQQQEVRCLGAILSLSGCG